METNRIVFGEMLVELAKQDSRIVLVDSDIAKTLNYMPFIQEFPERHFDCGIAEQNMFSVAGGLSTCGLIPFVSSYAVFTASRGLDQIRNGICYSALNVKTVGTHGGLETGKDGGTHKALEDIAIMRTLPGMVVLVPSTPNMTRWLVKKAAFAPGPVYLRFGREASPEYYPDDEAFEYGESKTLSGGDDVAILSCGNMLSLAQTAADTLKAGGRSVRVIDMYSIKPIDKQAVIQAAKETAGIVTVEDHSVIGGLGGAVSEVVAAYAPAKVLRVGVEDMFGRSGDAQSLNERYGLTAEHIVQCAQELLK